MLVRHVRSQELPSIAELIVTENRQPGRHCIQSETGTDVPSTAAEMRRRLDANELAVVAAFEGPDLVGALGCEFDVSSKRGWLRGPFARDGSDHVRTFRGLLAALLDVLPEFVERVDAFLNVANTRATGFYLNSGFEAVRHVHVYAVRAEDVDVRSVPEGADPPPALERATADLHDALFPDTYVSGAGILAERDADHRLFTRCDDTGTLGYVYVVADHDADEGFVTFLGVRADARGRGVGEDLLRCALRWGFETKRLPRMALSVHDELANARSLYERAGFRLDVTGQHLRRDLDPPARGPEGSSRR